MPIPTPLPKKLREALGADAGDELVTWLQEMRAEHEEKLAAIHADWTEYRHEMAALIQGSEARLVARIHQTEVTLGDRIHAVETKLEDRIGAVETKLEERIHRLDDRIHKLDDRIGSVEVRVADAKADLMKWSFVFWVGAVGAIAALAGVLR